jgi:nitrous oxide reductase accessory protein NosL
VKILWIVVFALLMAAPGGLAGDMKPITPTERDKCPVCGMFVYKYPDFVAEILFQDGTYAMFDGVKDMLKYYFHMEKYNPSKKKADIGALYVTDYYSLNLIDAFKACYVVGSDIYGPMGKELIPFEKEEDAREFMVDHSGKALYKFDEITHDILKSLD